MKHVTVAELKAHLDAYLAEVRNGHTFVVSHRRTPVARLEPVGDRGEGVVVARARRPARDLRRVRGIKLRRRLDVGKTLRQSREER